MVCNIKESKCGDCKLCCKVFVITELHKLAGEWCRNCPTKGCDIYDSRPEVCKQYRCMWLARPKLFSEEFRPDKIGVVFNECWEVGMFPLIEAHESYKGAFQKVKKNMEPVLGMGWGIAVCHLGGPHTILPPYFDMPFERGEWLERVQQRLAERCQITAYVVSQIKAEREAGVGAVFLADQQLVQSGMTVDQEVAHDD